MSEKVIKHWKAKLEGADYINISINGWPAKMMNGQIFTDKAIPAAYPHLFEIVYEDEKVEIKPLTATNEKTFMVALDKAKEEIVNACTPPIGEELEDELEPELEEGVTVKTAATVANSNSNVESFTNFALSHSKEECNDYLQPLHYTIIREIATYYGLDATGKKAATIELIIGEL